ncbi:MAG: two-component sensor histidine kinase, partial [Gemmatimonadetes bacterium]|nr:two-component sensor histidine kinase [Gemmatimonadota bacterium]
LESFLSARTSALNMLVQERSYSELRDPRELSRVLSSVDQAFGGFVDLGVIDDDGIQIAYAGPYALEGRSYAAHEWFHAVRARGVYVSDVFLGYRDLPHFVIAVQGNADDGERFVLRATFNTDVINRLVNSLLMQASGDAFIINGDGILQTPSRFYGGVLEVCPLPRLPYSPQAEILEAEDEAGDPLTISYARIGQSPFTVVLVSPRRALHEGWISLRRNLLVFLAVSVVLILAVVFGGSTYMVNRAQESDIKRAALYHKMEYTNKMAAIGRLGAGVAHEINNPLSIINEKAGLLKDLLMLSQETPPRDKLLGLVSSVIKSADRCGQVTHRLLGFAKHMEVQRETIELDHLLYDVLSFLEREANYRDIIVDFKLVDDPPEIVSDQGQLQQVFLNIVNNAFAAVDKGGHIDIEIARVGPDMVAVTVTDDGAGIPDDHLPHIFDPFFTTKKGGGTGLGLSITYGIVQKLGGQIRVKSRVGEGTSLTVTLPVNAPDHVDS